MMSMLVMMLKFVMARFNLQSSISLNHNGITLPALIIIIIIVITLTIVIIITPIIVIVIVNIIIVTLAITISMTIANDWSSTLCI